VHRLPQWPGFDVGLIERAPHCIAVGAENGGIDQDAGQAAVAARVGRLGHEGDAGHAVEEFPVAVFDPSARVDALTEGGQLRAPDRGQKIAEPVVEAEFGVLVVRHRLACLCRELPRVLDLRFVLRE
jgi:hypothetical protein